jgi:hypothetical protein
MINKILTSIGIILIAATAIFFMTRGSVKAPIQSLKVDENGHVPVTGSGEYILNLSQGMLRAQGKKPLIAGYTDIGGISFKSGSIIVTDGKISGNFTVDMNSLSVESTGKKSGETMLQRHLKSSDFFDVEKYPESSFVTTSTKKTVEDNLYMVTGNLTIKGITQPITFPSVIFMKNDQLIAEGSMELDRTRWGVKYGSGKFFDNLGDNLIGDTFLIEFQIVADLKK